MNDRTEPTLRSSTTPEPWAGRPDGAKAGTTIGGHIRILEPLGRGGMGEVYVGFDETLQRRVALKAVAPHRRSDSELRGRLLREARILSRLDHPNICRIYDYVAGESDENDYLVLELVEGQTLRRLISDGLEPKLRLPIARQITAALAAAHAKGVIHRDLKPANVMLTPEGEAKVLDFGIARFGEEQETPPPSATDGDSSPEDEVHTSQGSVMGTLAYMSPEQARSEPPTPSSDLYSLGLLLQELFTGGYAYPRALPLPALLERVDRGETLPVTGVDRHLAALIEELKSPAAEDRPSADQAARRLAWIADKPRRRLRWLVAGVVATTLVAGSVKYAFDLRHERNQAVAAQASAEQRSAELEEVVGYLVGMFELAAPDSGGTAGVTAHDILEQGAARLEYQLGEQPQIQARLLETIGSIHRQLGLYSEARPLLSRALDLHRTLFGEDSPETARSLGALGSLDRLEGRYEDAERRYRRSLEILEAQLGADHRDVATALNNLALLYRATGDYRQAELLLARSLEISGRAAPASATTLSNLASVLVLRGEHELAEQLLEEALALSETTASGDELTTASALNGLGLLYQERGELDRAEALFRRSLELYEHSLGEEHPWVAALATSLANLYRAQGELDEAARLFRRSLAIKERTLEPDHPSMAATLHNLALLHAERDELEEAERLLARAAEIWRRALGEEHPNLARTLHHQGRLKRLGGNADAAERLLRQALAIERQTLSPEHLYTRETLAELAQLLRATGRAAAASQLESAAPIR